MIRPQRGLFFICHNTFIHVFYQVVMNIPLGICSMLSIQETHWINKIKLLFLSYMDKYIQSAQFNKIQFLQYQHQPYHMSVQKIVKLIKKGDKQKVAQRLQDPTFNINELDPKSGKTLTQIAIESEQSQIFNMLVKTNGIKLDTLSKSGQTVLQSAILMNSPDFVQQLLRAKINCKIKNSEGHSAMYTAIKNKTSPQIIKKLIFHNFDVNEKIPTYGCLLNLAIACNQFQNFTTLLSSSSIDLKIHDEQDNTSLLLCVKLKQGQFIQALFKKLQLIQQKSIMNEIQKQFYINACDQEGDTVLHIAAKKDYQVILDLLVREGPKYGLDLDAKNKQGKTYEDIANERIEGKKKEKQNEEYQQKKRIEQKKIKAKQKQQERIRAGKEEQLQRSLQKKRKRQEQALEEKRKQLAIQMERNKKLWIGLIFIVVLLGVMYLLFLKAAGGHVKANSNL